MVQEELKYFHPYRNFRIIVTS